MNFLILYLPCVFGFYLPAIVLHFLKGEKLSEVDYLTPSIMHTIVNLHILLPLQVAVLLPFYSPNADFNFAKEGLLLVGCVVLAEIWFYGVHRLFHTPFFYARFHRIHHRIRRPHAIHSGYQHPLEFLIPTMGTCFIGPILLCPHNITTSVWLFLMMGAGVVGHGGYFPKSLRLFRGHDHHHHYITQNYGFLFLDILFRTTGKFSSHRRDKTSTPTF